jgi:hypothetical protein
VATYELHTPRDLTGGVAYGHTRIELVAHPGGAATVVHLYYIPPFNYRGMFVSGELTAYPLPAELASHLGVLRSENPVYVHWEMDPADPNGSLLKEVYLATSEEYPGEGDADTSPF